VSNGGDAVDQGFYITQLNIDHFRRKLATEQDRKTRQVIADLLAKEQAKLAALSDRPRKLEGTD
jgi:hypothetical protein